MDWMLMGSNCCVPNQWTFCGSLFIFLLFLKSFIKAAQHDFWLQVTSGARSWDEYDYVIVGGGSAGAVVANRLSENLNWTVVLLEAGGEESPVAEVPAMIPMLQGSEIDWNYLTAPSNKSCLAWPNQRCTWPRGKLLGGSSAINGMLYTRGNRKDYDEWAALGNNGWSFKEVLPYFLKSEDNHDPRIASNTKYHAKGGYQCVERLPFADINVGAVMRGLRELGYQHRDVNGQFQTGYMRAQTTSRRGERCSTARSFLRPVQKRANLRIITAAMVIKIYIHPISKQAVAIKYLKNSRQLVIKARREIIICAGTIGSPQLLMLSGVGPKDHLNQLQIPVLMDLKVGYNLQDHVSFRGVLVNLNNTVTVPTRETNRVLDYRQYYLNNTGPLTAVGVLQVAAFVKTNYANNSAVDYPRGRGSLAPLFRNDNPDIQFHFIPLVQNGTATREPFSYYDSFIIAPTLLKPKSIGRIRLNSTDPTQPPIIDANYFAKNIDLQTLVEGAKIGVNLAQTKALKNIGAKLNSTALPNCTKFKFGTNEYWKCAAQQYTQTIYHPIGTCKMGPYYDLDAVVSPQLKVYGIDRLRVIDASVIPVNVRGNTNAPVIMIAEKGADMIKETWKNA